MTSYELLNLLLAVVASVIALVSLSRTRRFQRQQMQLNTVVEELSRKQLDILDAQSQASARASVRAELIGASPSWWFLLTNDGQSPARNVDFKLLDLPEASSPLVRGDYDQKIPIPILQPGSAVRLIASISHDTPLKYNTKVTWTNPDGSEQSAEYFLAL